MAEKTKADLELELADAQRENESLRRQLAERPATGAAPRAAANPEPRFELSAGEAADLAAHGHARSVRTGETLLASEFPDAVAAIDGVDPDEDRELARLERRDAAEESARKDRDARAARAEHEARLRGI